MSSIESSRALSQNIHNIPSPNKGPAPIESRSIPSESKTKLASNHAIDLQTGSFTPASDATSKKMSSMLTMLSDAWKSFKSMFSSSAASAPTAPSSPSPLMNSIKFMSNLGIQFSPPKTGPTAEGQRELATLKSDIQTEHTSQMKDQSASVGQLGADFFRSIPKMEVILPGGERVAGTAADGPKKVLQSLFSQDAKIPDSVKKDLETTSLNDMTSLSNFLEQIPKDSMSYSVFKMTTQSMQGGLNQHMADAGFQSDTPAFLIERGSDRKISLDLSDLKSPKVTFNQIYDYKTNPSSESPDFSVSTGLGVQYNMETGHVESSVDFKSIQIPTKNPSLKGVQDHFKNLGAIVK